jgi:uncharacterized membrane protein YfcA
LGSACGAWTVTYIDPSFLRKALPFLLIALLIYTLAKKNMGQLHEPRFQGKKEALVAAGMGLLIGFYDGFFGPGTGSFFVFAYVRFLGYDFLNASASSKLMNTATNFSALALFTWQGHVWWHLAIPMALANVIGSLIGIRLALQYGAGFVRYAFLVVVSMLIMKTAYDGFLR